MKFKDMSLRKFTGGISLLVQMYTHSNKSQGPDFYILYFHATPVVFHTYKKTSFHNPEVPDHSGRLDQLSRKHKGHPSAAQAKVALQGKFRAAQRRKCSGQYFSRELFQIPHKSNWWPWINHSSHLCAEWEKTSQQLMHAKAFGGDGWRHYSAFRQWHAIRENHFIE